MARRCAYQYIVSSRLPHCEQTLAATLHAGDHCSLHTEAAAVCVKYEYSVVAGCRQLLVDCGVTATSRYSKTREGLRSDARYKAMPRDAREAAFKHFTAELQVCRHLYPTLQCRTTGNVVPLFHRLGKSASCCKVNQQLASVDLAACI